MVRRRPRMGRGTAKRVLGGCAAAVSLMVLSPTAVVSSASEPASVGVLVGALNEATTRRVEAERAYREAAFTLEEAVQQRRAQVPDASSRSSGPVRAATESAALDAAVTRARATREVAIAALARSLSEEHTLAAQVQGTVAATGVWEAAGHSEAIGIPQRALDILTWTAGRSIIEHPACNLDWSVLAGISLIESNHGRFGGAQILRDGTAYPPIRGLQLNGDGVAAISDTDGGAYDGDASYDRAVGPFQFIPSTWASYGRDADGDGLADPNNYRDAALAASDYLCAAGGDLGTPAGLRRAIHAYNHSDEYVDAVVGQANAYRSRMPSSGS